LHGSRFQRAVTERSLRYAVQAGLGDGSQRVMPFWFAWLQLATVRTAPTGTTSSATLFISSNMSNMDRRAGHIGRMLDASSPGLMTESSVALPPPAFEVCMDHFIHEQNLAHYRKVLSETTDPTKRLTVLKLLADEQANHRPPTAGTQRTS
jgi:hypothetical protein